MGLENLSPAVAARFWKKVRVVEPTTENPDPCWNWIGSLNSNGYGQVRINKVLYRAHRVSIALEEGGIADDVMGCHTCDNPSCVRYSHLYKGDHATNAHDRDERGRRKVPKGDANWCSKVTYAQVCDIRRLYVYGSTTLGIKGLAKRFKIGRQQVWNIVNGVSRVDA